MSYWGALKLRTPWWAWLLFLVGIFFFLARLTLDSRFAGSAFLYLAIPFLISVLLFQFGPRGNSQTLWGQYVQHMSLATIIMLATSALLFEGFICVLFFIPIYWLAVSFGYLCSYLWMKYQNRHYVHILPLLFLGLSMEGVSPLTSQPRENVVTQKSVVSITIPQLKANMAEPIRFDNPNNWFLALFPMPTNVEAGSLSPGDIHKVHFTYKRWFFTNIHNGTMEIEISEVGENFVRTKVLSNSGYLATYLKVKGTEVLFREIDEHKTEVSLTIHYDRQLDPAWYFGPLQRFAVNESAKHLMHSVIVRGADNG